MKNKASSTVHKRVNITLPEETLRLIDRAAHKGSRSRFIDAAVRRYVTEVGKARLRQSLEDGYRRERGRDLKIAEEWFAVDEEAWQKRR